MRYAALNIEKDPLEQGFESERYDLIVCCLVLHATADLYTTLQNVHKLLKPGGKLMLVESSNPDCARVSFVFGLLPGWWLATEEKRKRGPLLSDADWHSLLLETGFSGAEVNLPDAVDARRHTFSGIISTAVKPCPMNGKHRKTIVISSNTSSIQRQVASKVAGQIPFCEVSRFPDINWGNIKNNFCIFLLELEDSFLAEMNVQDFTALKSMVGSANGVLWITVGRDERPESGFITGFGRNIGSERWEPKFVELALERETSVSRMVDDIVRVHHRSLVLGDVETEYTQSNGRLCISRIVEAESVAASIDAIAPGQSPKGRVFGTTREEALQLKLASPGLLDSFRFEDDGGCDKSLNPNEVEIKVKATGLNFKDLMIAIGQLPGNSLGFECAGILTRLGEGTSFNLGDRVLCCTTTGAYNTYARAHATSVARLPEGLSFTTAAALPTVFCTAYHALFNVARLQTGESILIHSGAGGVGQAAIQLAKLLNANIFTTVGTDVKKVYLMDTYGIREDHIFQSRNAAFERPLKQLTEGVDVVLNSLSGSGLYASWSCLRPFGRFVELGKADIQSHGGLPMGPFDQSITFASVDLGLITEKAKSTMAATLAAVMALFSGGKITVPQPLHVFGISELEKAFRFMQSGKNMGKIVVEMQEDAIVPVSRARNPFKFAATNC